MTISTTSPAGFEAEVAELVPPCLVPVSAPPYMPPPEDVTERLAERFGPPAHGDPGARTRLVQLVHDVTGWEIPGIPTDRDYVSKLWAEDWDNPDDAVYDSYE